VTSPTSFVDELLPGALSSQRAVGIPASFTIAEAALESGWGTSLLAVQGKNLFGVKADLSWHGPTIDMRTREFEAGVWTIVIARWRSYASWADCISDHAAFLRSNPRYSSCFQTKSGAEFAARVAAAGYATDPTYADKLQDIIRYHSLDQYDAL